MPRDYYVVLGIAHSATAEEIHAAFRRRSKELHPDISGTDSEPFLELREAYSVLSHPARRRDYDSKSATRVHVRPARSMPRGFTVPLQPHGRNVVLCRRPVAEPISARPPAADDFQLLRRSIDDWFDQLWWDLGA